MNEQIQSEKMVTGVAEPFLLKLDLQYFADDLGEDEGSADEGTGEFDNNLDEGNDDLDTGDGGEGDNSQGSADLGQTPPIQDDRANAAFAQMRREKEAAETQLRQMDAMIADQYGHMGINTFAEYQQALESQQQELQRQQYAEAGLPEDLVDKLSKVDEILQRDQVRQEQEQKQLVENQINAEFQELASQYPDLGLKDITDIFHLPIYQQMEEKVAKGYSLLDAYEVSNRAELRTKAINSGKQSALNQINSKAHLRGNGGEGSEDIDITSVPADVMQNYRQMFAKELRSGKMTEADFVKDYKKHAKG